MTLNTYSTTSPKRQTALLAYEVNPDFTRGSREITAAADTEYPVGTLLAEDGGATVVLTPGGTGTTGTFIGFVLDGCAIEAGNSRAVLTLEKGPARVKETGIEWGAATEPQKTALRAQIAALGIDIVQSVGAPN